eukprot:3133422-Prymnesium_polylepis.1
MEAERARRVLLSRNSLVRLLSPPCYRGRSACPRATCDVGDVVGTVVGGWLGVVAGSMRTLSLPKVIMAADDHSWTAASWRGVWWQTFWASSPVYGSMSGQRGRRVKAKG